MMNNLKTWILPLVILLFCACQNYESVAPETSIEIEEYDGTLLEYLSDEVNNKLHQKFDSMLVIINAVPGLKEELEKEDQLYTVFAIPNESFDHSFGQLNAYRSQNKLGANLSLDDLLIEPFIVEYTIITLLDTITVTREYDYRAQVDSLLCRYIFEGEYATDDIMNEEGSISTGSFKNKYPMNMTCEHQMASGIAGGGNKYFTFSDMNESQLKEIWKTTHVVWKDIHTRNGIIHILTDQHSFSYDKFINYFQNRGNEYEHEKE